ncbi:MAG: hypothetical protein ACK46O_01090 [Flavobacteriia bacterium]
MKILLSILVMILTCSATGQIAPKKKERFPSYFGFQVRPVFPTRFIGEPEIMLSIN